MKFMPIKQHYLLNLKRRPQRLYTWIGAQDQMGFDFSKLTIFEAINGKAFATVGEMAESLSYIGCDLIDRQINNDNDSMIYKGLYGGLFSAIVMLLQIEAASTDEYTVIWEDDAVLTEPYDVIRNIHIPEDANIITFGKGFDEHATHLVEKWDQREEYLHESNIFYHGIMGCGFTRCYAVNSEGANQLLDLHRREPTSCYEGALMAHPDQPHLYTYAPDIVRLIHSSGFVSDIFPDERNRKVLFKRTSVKKIYKE